MAKRSHNVGNSEWIKVSDDNTMSEPSEYIEVHFELEPEIKTTRLILLKDLHLKYYGKATGNLYEFPRGGTTLEIDNRDLPDMLAKMGGNCTSCPSSIGRTPYFAVVEG